MAEEGGTAEDRDLLAVLRLFAERAGKIVLASYIDSSSILELKRKADGTPVTPADEASEELLVEALSTLTPEIPVLAEERLSRKGLPRPLPERFWLVDPLDGTKQFLAQNAEFTVNIALIEGGRPTAGVVHAPALAMSWSGAGPGSAAFSETDRPPMAIRARRLPAEGALCFTDRYRSAPESLQAAEARFPGAKCQQAGAGLAFGLLATGKADLYARLEPTPEWTTAAGQAVLQAAGGRVETPDGRPLAYGKPGLMNRGFLALGAGAS